MVTTAEIKSLVPDAINVRSAGQRGAFSSGGETPNYIKCTHQITLPEDTPGLPTTIEVSIENVADPRIIKVAYDREKERSAKFSKSFPDQYKDYGTSMGAEGTFLDINSLKSRTGPFYYEVGGRHTDLDTDYKKSQQEWREKTLAKVVRLISEKIKSGGGGGTA